MNAQQLQVAFQHSNFIRYFYYYDTIPSTNAKARELAAAGAGDGGLVVADAQSAGRGRENRTWFSGPGLGLYQSFIFRPGTPAASAFGLQMAVALAALETLEALGHADLGIKWPNDLLAGEAKLGGMLSEVGVSGGRVEWCVVGLGLNTGHLASDFPADLAGKAVSLRMLSGQAPDRLTILRKLVEHVGEWYRTFLQEGIPALAPIWRGRSTLIGAWVRVKTSGETYVGTVAGIEDTGALRLRLESGVDEVIHAGDVHRIQVSPYREDSQRG